MPPSGIAWSRDRQGSVLMLERPQTNLSGVSVDDGRAAAFNENLNGLVQQTTLAWP